MANYKRQMWTSGYEYRTRCPQCGTFMSYTDRQLGYRSWYPNGFIYCSRCRKPIRHSEFFAVFPDGTPVYKTVAEAEAAVTAGYYAAMGMPPPVAAAPVQPAAAPVQPEQEAPVDDQVPGQIDLTDFMKDWEAKKKNGEEQRKQQLLNKTKE